MGVLQNFDDLKSLKVTARGWFTDYWKEIKEDEAMYDLDFKEDLNIPEKFKADAIVLPTAREVIDNAVDHVSPKFRRITVPRESQTENAVDRQQKLRKFYEALLNYLEAQATPSPFRDGTKHLATYGMEVDKLVFDRRKWPKKVTKQKRGESDESFEFRKQVVKNTRDMHMPFTHWVVNPMEIVFDKFNQSPQWVIESKQMFAGDAQQIYPDWTNPNNRKSTELVDVDEYWDFENRAVAVDETSALRNPLTAHGWGTHPYSINSSGLGIDDSDHRIEKKYVSIIRFIKDILKSESRNYSIMDIVLKQEGWPIRIAVGENANDFKPQEMEYGITYPMPEGVVVTNLKSELPPQAVAAQMQLANSIISSAAAPRVTRGGNTPGLTSGFDRQLTLSEARLRFGPLAAAKERALTQICKKAAVLMKNVVKESVPITPGTKTDEFMSIGPKDFTHDAVFVEVNVAEPEDEIRKHSDAIAMVQAGLWSPQTAIERTFPDLDPQNELARIVAAKVLFSPQMIGLISQIGAQKFAEDAGIEELLAQLTAALNPDGEETGRSRSPRNPDQPNREQAQGQGSRSDQAEQRQLDQRSN